MLYEIVVLQKDVITTGGDLDFLLLKVKTLHCMMMMSLDEAFVCFAEMGLSWPVNTMQVFKTFHPK
jgi:hypothetical protein